MLKEAPTSQRNFWKEFIPKSWVCLRDRYSFALFKGDLFAGVTVGIIAIPLAMAFAIASGVTPERGIYTAIVAGFLISLLGGSRSQIGGPTGAFVVIIYGIIERHGYDGLVFATLIASVILIILGLSRLGGLIKYIPYPLVTGFTTGIALLIFSSQVKDFFGLKMEHLPAGFVDKWQALFHALPTGDPLTFAVSAGTLLLILVVRRFFPIVPWGVISIVLATAVCWGFHLPLETIASRYGEIPRTLPFPGLPEWTFSFANWHSLIPDAITIAFLAGIESLLSSVIADGMAGTRHKSNCELVAQGVANMGSVFFGGIPATGAIARTATNVKTGGRTPVAGMIHALTLFLAILIAAPVVSQIPLAALSAVLIMVAWNMSEVGHFRHLFKAPLGDVILLLMTFFLTIFIDLTVAVEVGMIFAAFLLVKRMSAISGIAPFLLQKEEEERDDLDAIEKKQVPPHVEVYEITGPFFFGVADRLKDVLVNMEFTPMVFILRMRDVPLIDASGMHALKEFFFKCQRKHTTLLLSGVQPDVRKSLKKFGLEELIGNNQIFTHIDPALLHAAELVKMHQNAS
jgi:SulP family sulfate permease